MAGRSSSHVANSVLSSHLATMGDFNFESLDLLGEFDSLRISKASRLAKFIPRSIKYFAHEINDRLCSVESSSGYVDVQHHLPLAGAHTLMETEPDFSTTSKGWGLSNRSREERPSDWSVSHRWQVTHDNVESLNSFEGNAMKTPVERKFQRVKRNSGDPLNHC